jgi:hypothetical protein
MRLLTQLEISHQQQKAYSMPNTTCRAANPSVCRYHGRFSRKYEEYAKPFHDSNTEPQVVFEKVTVERVSQDNRHLVSISDLGDNKTYRFMFLQNVPNAQTGQTETKDDSFDVQKEEGKTLADTLNKEVDRLYNGNTHSRRNEQMVVAYNAVEYEGGVKQFAQGDVIRAAGNTPHIEDDWGFTPANIHTIYQYGKEAEKLNLREEETALVMHESLMKHENFRQYSYGDDEYDEQLIGCWSIYNTYKKALARNNFAVQ